MGKPLMVAAKLRINDRSKGSCTVKGSRKPELHFKGKEIDYNHRLTVPYRPLIAQPDKSLGDNPENLIIHGDNLHALKALLPRYAGKVDL
jgi:adenine-specific DNA-methyltransferase